MIASTAKRRLLWTARIEGISFLVLLGVAMPLKYLAGEPLAVRIFGAVHGVLFIAFALSLVLVASAHQWTVRRVGTWLVASLIPLALFFLERDLRRE